MRAAPKAKATRARNRVGLGDDFIRRIVSRVAATGDEILRLGLLHTAEGDPELRARRGSALALGGQISVGPLPKFFSLTFAVTWICFIAAAMTTGGVASSSPKHAGPAGLLLFLGSYTPALVALWLAAGAEGRAGVQTMFRRMLQWRAGAQWYLFALGYMAASKLTAALVHRMAVGAWPRFGQEAWFVIIAEIAITAIGVAGEEIGWQRVWDWRGRACYSERSGPAGTCPSSLFPTQSGRTVIPDLTHDDDRGVGCLRMALRAHQRKPAARRPDALGD